VRRFERQGESREQIARRLGLTPKSLERALFRATEYQDREPELIAEAG